MGEYYDWVNVDRKEYLSPGDFRLGSKAHQSMWREESSVLGALRELLANEWKGSHIFWMGDECELPKNTGLVLFDKLLEHSERTEYPGDMLETVLTLYTNKAGLFSEAEENVREEIEIQLNQYKECGYMERNEYGINIKDPYKGLFLRKAKSFDYTINYTKKVCYSFEKTKIYKSDGSLTNEIDPLPMLMGYGRTLEPGEWLGDIIGVSDCLPDYITILDEIHLDV